MLLPAGPCSQSAPLHLDISGVWRGNGGGGGVLSWARAEESEPQLEGGFGWALGDWVEGHCQPQRGVFTSQGCNSRGGHLEPGSHGTDGKTRQRAARWCVGRTIQPVRPQLTSVSNEETETQRGGMTDKSPQRFIKAEPGTEWICSTGLCPLSHSPPDADTHTKTYHGP